jgi:hypothetical protein
MPKLNGHADPFDPDSLRLQGKAQDVLRQRLQVRRPRHRPSGRFVKGPIPLDWLLSAGQLPHHALHIGMLLWFEAGCRRKRTVAFCLARGQGMRLSGDTTRRALRALERAGLVSVVRQPGRGLEVTLLDAPAVDEGGLSHGPIRS